MNAQSQREIRWKEITLARKFFNGSCHFCGKSIITNRKRPKPHTKLDFKGFQYHHLRYVQGEPRSKDYGKNAFWDYKKAVLPIVEKHPDEFLLVDRGCHKILELVLIKHRKNPEFILKLDLGVRMTQTATVVQRMTPIKSLMGSKSITNLV